MFPVVIVVVLNVVVVAVVAGLAVVVVVVVLAVIAVAGLAVQAAVAVLALLAVAVRLGSGAVPVLTRNTVFLSCCWLLALIWWESSLVSSTAMKVFPESVFRQTIVLCSRAASRSSTCWHQTHGEEQVQGGMQ